MNNMIITYDYVGLDGKVYSDSCRGNSERLFLNLDAIISFSVYYFDEQGRYVREAYFILDKENEYSNKLNELYFRESQRLIRNWINQRGLNKNGYFDRYDALYIDGFSTYSNEESYKELKNKLEKLDSQKNEQNALLSVLGKIRDYANILEVPSNTTVEEFMKHTHMCSSRNELTAKLIEMMLYAEKENKGKRR